ncbi:MAG: sensor domain-containing protein [Alphaproteobacteria bacterium]|nr:sensor domain-containing protein [Alphaproteobacteria bacterium]MBU6471120.1 sensor domain-containing protein [Alphaproteobacteria bacterium]MDE2011707.1 sensor domain-containing protein [Alphaproteobacteria bacterium]MDE2074323.1 sensor domain-containing protein [Alphaproteobacteria bacterium]MDE2353126.1 sensor domain-containing protein [Alphaproteobacteria bacterium]
MSPGTEPRTVRAYLDALRRALKGCSPGLIADALADCEEHLNNELANKPGMDEAAILATVVETYGSPEEIAEEYRSMEATLSGPFPKPEPAPTRRYGFFNVVSDPRAYGALLYMLLSLATGVFYFAWTVAGFSMTLGFAILIIGIPFALLFIASERVLALVEGRIVEGLLGVRMPRRLPAAASGDETIFVRIRDALTDVRTWSSMFYLLLMLPLGVVYFCIATVGLSLSFGVVYGAMWSLVTGESHVRIDDAPWLEHLLSTAPGLILLVLLGVLVFFVMLHVARAVGWLHGRIAEALLVRL